MMKLVEIFKPRALALAGGYKIGLVRIRRRPYLKQIILYLDYAAAFNKFFCLSDGACTHTKYAAWSFFIIWFLHSAPTLDPNHDILTKRLKCMVRLQTASRDASPVRKVSAWPGVDFRDAASFAGLRSSMNDSRISGLAREQRNQIVPCRTGGPCPGSDDLQRTKSMLYGHAVMRPYEETARGSAEFVFALVSFDQVNSEGHAETIIRQLVQLKL